MAISEWVVDTQILEIASTGEHPLALDAAALLRAIRECHLVAIDCEGEIVHEYDPHLRPGTLAEQWWAQMNQRAKIRWHSHRLSQARRRKLSQLGFDASDWKFVGVASRTASRLLVAEESDYWAPAVAHCIQNEMRISLVRITEAVQQA